MSELHKVALITFGKGGDSVYFKDPRYSNGHQSGYEDPESFEKRVAEEGTLWLDLEGALVVDERAVITVKNVLASPMPSADLEPGRIDRFDTSLLKDSLMVQAMLGDPGNQFGGLIAAHLAGIGSLDTVAPDVYVAWWKQQGARCGTWRAGTIEWEE